MSRAPLALYLHIPFCARKCAYCDFLSFDPGALGGDFHALRRSYFRSLEREIDLAAAALPADAYRVRSIYLGGGTPSLADPGEIASLLERCGERFEVSPEAEISLECNPGTADRGKLRELKDAGANRLSIGVQSFDDGELEILGRIHTGAEALRCYEDARAAGFANVNLDLMAALPGQTQASLLRSVARAAALAPEHLSLYSLIIEPGTPFHERYAAEVPDPHYDRPRRGAGGEDGPYHTGSGADREAPVTMQSRDLRSHLRTQDQDGIKDSRSAKCPAKFPSSTEQEQLCGPSAGVASESAVVAAPGAAVPSTTEPLQAPRLPEEEEERAMLHGAWRCLEDAGYERYEISNFARLEGAGTSVPAASPYRCRQNLAYWRREEYLGLGLGAASLIGETRFSNTRDLRAYLGGLDGGMRPGRELAVLQEEVQRLTAAERMEEFMFLGLRLAEGVREADFLEAFGSSFREVYGGVTERLIGQGLVAREGGRVFLTERGTDLANVAMAEYLL